MNAQMIIDEFKAMIESYIKQYAEFMYWEAKITHCADDHNVSELEDIQPSVERHKNTLKNILDDLYMKYGDPDETEDAYYEAEEKFGAIIKDAKREGCKRAEAMRQANGIYIK